MPEASLVVGENAGLRVLALDVRSQKFGFVVFEGSSSLLDWGVSSYAPQYGAIDVTVERRIVNLLEVFPPSVMVLRVPHADSGKRNARIRVVMKTLIKEARRRSISLRILGRERVRNFFIARGHETKQQIAAFLAERFPDLAWKLPPKRKPWQSEKYHMSIFDAAAVGVAYFGLPDIQQT
jgi:hypothetical protein